jgi:ABC-type phosphate/phosphonate transport system permease subunit
VPQLAFFTAAFAIFSAIYAYTFLGFLCSLPLAVIQKSRQITHQPISWSAF